MKLLPKRCILSILKSKTSEEIKCVPSRLTKWSLRSSVCVRGFAPRYRCFCFSTSLVNKQKCTGCVGIWLQWRLEGCWDRCVAVVKCLPSSLGIPLLPSLHSPPALVLRSSQSSSPEGDPREPILPRTANHLFLPLWCSTFQDWHPKIRWCFRGRVFHVMCNPAEELGLKRGGRTEKERENVAWTLRSVCSQSPSPKPCCLKRPRGWQNRGGVKFLFLSFQGLYSEATRSGAWQLPAPSALCGTEGQPGIILLCKSWQARPWACPPPSPVGSRPRAIPQQVPDCHWLSEMRWAFPLYLEGHSTSSESQLVPMPLAFCK